MSNQMSEPSICRVCQWGRAAPVSLFIIIALHTLETAQLHRPFHIHTVRAPPKPLRTFSTAHQQAVKLACDG